MRLRDVALRIIGGKKPELRAIDGVPWDVGGPMRPSIVSAEQALGLVPVFAAVRLLASQVASLPLQNYRKTGDIRVRIASPSLFVQPSVQGTLYDWLHRCVTSLALRGNAYGLITARDRDQYPTMIEWLHPDDIWCDDRQSSGPGSFTSPLWYWQGKLVPSDDLLHIPWFTVPGRVQGLSPIGACAATISTGISAQNYTSDWFDNGAVPPGEFRNKEKTVNQTEADIISARLNAAIRRRKPLVYGNDWEYKPISVSAHEAKFIETSKMTATQVAAIYGIPPEMIGGEAGGPLTYNTVEQNTLNFVKFTLQPWLVLLEDAFFPLMPRPQYIKFNVDALLRSDLQTRMAAYQVARQIGLSNIDEQRALEDLPPLPDGKGKDYTPLPILARQSEPQPVATRYVARHADVLDAETVETMLGIQAALQLQGRRDDPYHPAALGSDAGPKVRKFNPLQPRDPGGDNGGQWIKSPAGAAKAVAKVIGDAITDATKPRRHTLNPTVAVRPDLAIADTVERLAENFNHEVERITGRRIPANFGTSLPTAKEHAEGILRGLERFPDARLIGVGRFQAGDYEGTASNAFAVALAYRDGSWIEFGDEWASAEHRSRYTTHLMLGVDGGFHAPGSYSPASTAIHEFGHVLDIGTLAERIHGKIGALLKQRAAAEGITRSALVKRDISKYALKNRKELVAEAFTDVMLNGDDASPLSQEIFALLEEEYRKAAK